MIIGIFGTAGTYQASDAIECWSSGTDGVIDLTWIDNEAAKTLASGGSLGPGHPHLAPDAKLPPVAK